MEDNNPQQDESKFDMTQATQQRLATYIYQADMAGIHEDFKMQLACLDAVYSTISSFVKNMDKVFQKEILILKPRLSNNLSHYLGSRNEISRSRGSYTPQESITYKQISNFLKSGLIRYDEMLKDVLQKNNLLISKKEREEDDFLPE